MKKILLGLVLLLALCEMSVSFATSIPDNCKSYYDGCNNCSRQSIGGEMACTMMWCENPTKAVCREYFPTTSTGTTACPDIYAPVCGQPPMPICPAGMACIQMMPQPKTYSSKCVAKNAKAEILYTGECKNGLIEPIKACQMDAQICPDGTAVGRTGPNCTIDCSAHQKISTCTKEYVPVCAKDPKRACPDGAECFISDLRTYSNACMAKADGATIVSQGECSTNSEPGNSGGGSDGFNPDETDNVGACQMDAKICPDNTAVGRTGPNCTFDCSAHQKACTREYTPVCGTDGETYNNSCLAGETLISYKGNCLGANNEAKIKSILFSAIEKKLVHTSNPGIVATILENVAQKSTQLAQNASTPQKQGLYNYATKVIYEYLQTKVYEVYLKENLTTIIPGSNSSENSISWIDTHTAQITSLSGDTASATEVKVGVKDKILFYLIGE